MSVEAVARKDFQDAVRSRWLLVLGALFGLLIALAVYVTSPNQGTLTVDVLNSFVVNRVLVTGIIPIVALVVSYASVVGERETGTIKLLLSLPHSRSDVVFGKVLGRTAAFGAAIVGAYLLATVVGLVGGFGIDLGHLLGYTLFTVVLGAVYVSIGVGFSSAVRSQRVAIAGAFGLYFLFVPLWRLASLRLQFYLAGGGLPGWVPLEGPQVYTAFRLANPDAAFSILTGALTADELFRGDAVDLQLAAAAMLLAWILLPPLVGLLRFETEDL